MNDYVIVNGELYHHGVKGMKWGVRRAAKRDPNVRRLRKEYKSAEREKDTAHQRWAGTFVGKKRRAAAYKNYSEATKKADSAKKAYESAYKNTAKSISDGSYKKPTAKKQTSREKLARGAEVASRTVGKMAVWSLADDIFWGGAQKKAIKATGRLAVEAYMKARGRTVIGWVD